MCIVVRAFEISPESANLPGVCLGSGCGAGALIPCLGATMVHRARLQCVRLAEVCVNLNV